MKLSHRLKSKQTFLFLIVITISISLTSYVVVQYPNQEKQTCYGPAITSQSRHNQECWMCNNDPYLHECIDKWCFGVYTLTVSAPSGWHFTGEPSLNCVRDNQGSFAWNLGYTNRMRIVQRDPNFIKAVVYISSRSIEVNLKCEATKD